MSTKRLLAYFEDHQEAFLQTLKEFVELESPSYESKEAADKCSRFLQELFRGIGFEIEVLKRQECGDHVIARYGSGEKGTLLVGHYDTVFPLGTLKTMPFRIEGDKAFGPGICDMKGGIILGYYAIKALQELNLMPAKRISFFMNGDEEPGSFTSSADIVAEAKKHDNVLVLEPGLDAVDEIKASRYGRGTYKVTAYGRSAHSGSHPHLAVSPMLELAHQLIRINDMNDYEKGFTLAPTCIFSGVYGTCRVPEDGWFSMDVRFRTAQLAEEMHKKILDLQPITENTRIEVTGAIDKPPMEMNPALFEIAKSVGRELGMELVGKTVGGGSDGNFTSAAGVPTLDGMGMTGILLHNPGEYINISHVAPRGALLAGLIERI